MFNPDLSAALAGQKLELSLVDRAGKVQNFYAFADDIVDEMKQAMRETSAETREIAFEICALDTGFMREHIVVIESPGAQVFEIGWRAADFFDAGLAFYPMFVVLGTRFVEPRDPLTPAYQETKPRYVDRMTELVNRAVARRGMA